MSTTIVIRSCCKDGSSHGGFKWPLEIGTTVSCPDWDPTPNCGNGLHGLLPGQNDPGTWHNDGLFLAVEVEKEKIIDLYGKCKYPSGVIRFVAQNMAELTVWLESNNHHGPWYRSTQTAGEWSTQTAGDRSTQKAGDRSTQTAGDGSTQTAGEWSTQTAGDRSTQKAGDGSVLVAGTNSKQKAPNSVLICRYWSGSSLAIATLITGQNGIKNDAYYTFDFYSKTWKETTI